MSSEPTERPSDQAHLPALREEANNLPAPYSPFQELGRQWSNLPVQDPDGQRLLLAGLNGKHRLASESVNEVIELYAIVAHPVEVLSQDGTEFVPLTRCVLILHDGSMMETTGAVSVESVGRILRTYGLGPWHPPIKIRVESRTTRHGNKVYPLVPVTGDSQRMPWMNTKPAKKESKSAN